MLRQANAEAPCSFSLRFQIGSIAHTLLNTIALILFLGQGLTGARDLLEIPLSWQAPYIYQCDFTNRTCPPS